MPKKPTTRRSALLLAGLLMSDVEAQDIEAPAQDVPPQPAQQAPVEPVAVGGEESPDTAAPAEAAPANSPEEPVQLEEVVVVGIRRSLEQALDIKRDNLQLVDAIVAQDIGKFPDNNVVESLQRVTGVQITGRDGGEANTVNIRGLGDVSTTINGRQIFTSTDRSIALADIPASLLAGVNVYKTRSADLIEGGVAGQIDVRTHRPFDFDEPQMVLAARGVYASNTERTDPNISMMVSDRWDTDAGRFGALLNASFVQTRFRDETIWSGSIDPYALDGTRIPEFNADGTRVLTRGVPLSTEPGSTLNVDGVATEYQLLRDAGGMIDTYGKRTRPAANVSLQFSPDERSTYTWESFYTGQKARDSFSQFFGFVNGADRYADPVLFPGTNVIQQNKLSDPAMFTSTTARYSKTESFLHALGGEWQLTDRFKAQSEVVYQTSSFERINQAQNYDSTQAQLAVDFNRDNSGTPGFSYFDASGNPADLSDPADWTMGNYYDFRSKDRGQALTWDAKGEYAFDDAFFRRIEFGARVDRRKSKSNAGDQSANCADVQADCAATARAAALSTNPGDFYSGESVNVPRRWVTADYLYLLDNIDESRAFYGLAGAPAYNPANYFDITETNLAGFVQSDFETELPVGSLDGQIGLRVVQVDTDIDYNELADAGDWQDASLSKGRTDVLPSAVVRWLPTDELIARFAYGKTIGRPSFRQLNPTMTLNPPGATGASFGYANSGNPDLDPVEAQTFDLSLEYYFARSSSVYATLFKRDVDGFIVNVDRSITISDRTPELNGNYVLTSPQNAGSGKLDGLEVGFQWFPDGLPEWLRGIGIQSNYTWIDAESKDPVFDADDSTQQIGTETNPVVGVSDWAYSVVLAFERDTFSARLSWVDRGKFLTGYNYCCSMPTEVYQNGESSMDAQLTYNATEQLAVTFDATNITGELYRSYYGDENLFPQDTMRYSRTYALGMRYRF